MGESSNEGDGQKKQTVFTRRGILGLAGLTAAGLATKPITDKLGFFAPTSPEQTTTPLEIPPFDGITPQKEMVPVKDWGSEQVQMNLESSIRESLETGVEVVIELPEGEINIDKTITSIIPEGAKIRLKGHANGSRLKLNSALSDVSKEWGSFAEGSMLYFQDLEGELTIDGIEFDGGSARAKDRQGYTPPKSPWDSIVLIVGKGAGDRYDPAMDQQGKRQGKATIINSNFYNSESGGVVMQNIHDAAIEDSRGSKLDALFTAAWCDNVVGRNCRGEYFTSDGTYITSAINVNLTNWQIKTARQGYDLQGVQHAELNKCHAYDTAFAYNFTLSESDKKTPSGTIVVTDSHSDGSLTPFSIGPVQNLNVTRSMHTNIGAWYKPFRIGDFHHSVGIVPIKEAIENPISFIEYGSENLTSTREMKLEDVKMVLSPDASIGYNLVQIPGIKYSNR